MFYITLWDPGHICARNYLPRNSKYRSDSAVANANGVLVRLICDGLGPG